MGRFAVRLQEYLAEWERYKDAHHDQKREILLRFLRDVFPEIEDVHTVEVERGVRFLKVRGYIDLLISDLVFEIKRDLARELEDGVAKLQKYIPTLPSPKTAIGFVTDGRQFEVYRLKGEVVERIGSFLLQSDASDEAFLWLDSYLFQQRNIAPTVSDVIHRFGHTSPVFTAAMQCLNGMWNSVKGDRAALTKFEEWDALLRTVYGSEVGNTDLFLRHTYLALLVRLLAFGALMDRPPAPGEVEGVIMGSAFESRGLWNLVEEDFFAWPFMPQVAAQAMSFLGALAQRLGVYNLSAIRQDLLKELYQELVDPETRHYLGEFYTPDWLAELALREARFPSKRDGSWPSLLDPACGSGTFLFLAVQLLREAGLSGMPLVQHVFENVAGIDVHPLAVLTAKVNLLLALAPELRSGGLPYRAPLPVYLANSLQLAERKQRGAPITVPLHSRGLPRFPRDVPHSFQVPTEMTSEGVAAVDSLIDRITDLATTGGRPIEDLLSGLHAYLKDTGRSRFGAWWAANLRLLHFLVSHNRDTVYRFILRNAFRPTFFSERKFDFVCGNPPWLPYRDIRDRSYQRTVKTLVLQLDLLGSDDVKLFTQMEMATLFFMFSHTHYLRDGGTICFVMPRSVLTGAKQHAKFRQMVSGIERIIDCAEVEPLFNIPACVVIARKGGQDRWPTTALNPSGRLSRRNVPLATAHAQLTIKESPLARLPTGGGRPSPYLAKFIQGATIVPRCFWFVRCRREAWMTDSTRPHLETNPEIQDQAKRPWRGVCLARLSQIFCSRHFSQPTPCPSVGGDFRWSPCQSHSAPMERSG